MKRFFVLGVTAGLLLSLAGCGSVPSVGSGSSGSSGGSVTTSKGVSGVPGFVNEAYLNASEDVLVGIGAYKIGSDTSKIGIGKTMAETRARADITRQVSILVKDMVTDHAAASEVDPDAASAFSENITQTLSKRELKGTKTVKMEIVDGVLWVVMECSKSVVAAEVDQAVKVAKLAVPALVAFDALDRMDTAFSKEAAGGPVPVGD